VVNSGLKVIMLDLTARVVLRLLKSILRGVRVLTAIHPQASAWGHSGASLSVEGYCFPVCFGWVVLVNDGFYEFPYLLISSRYLSTSILQLN